MNLVDKLVRDRNGRTFKIACVKPGNAAYGVDYKNAFVETHSGVTIPLVDCTILVNLNHSVRGVDLLEEV